METTESDIVGCSQVSVIAKICRSSLKQDSLIKNILLLKLFTFFKPRFSKLKEWEDEGCGGGKGLGFCNWDGRERG